MNSTWRRLTLDSDSKPSRSEPVRSQVAQARAVRPGQLSGQSRRAAAVGLIQSTWVVAGPARVRVGPGVRVLGRWGRLSPYSSATHLAPACRPRPWQLLERLPKGHPRVRARDPESQQDTGLPLTPTLTPRSAACVSRPTGGCVATTAVQRLPSIPWQPPPSCGGLGPPPIPRTDGFLSPLAATQRWAGQWHVEIFHLLRRSGSTPSIKGEWDASSRVECHQQ